MRPVMRQYSFRLVAADVESWKELANRVGCTLSEWIRRQCNFAAMSSAYADNSKPENVPWARDAPAPQRRMGAAEGTAGTAPQSSAEGHGAHSSGTPRPAGKRSQRTGGHTIDNLVSRKTNHTPGCTCLTCSNTRRFLTATE